jgi:hypothetical protein
MEEENKPKFSLSIPYLLRKIARKGSEDPLGEVTGFGDAKKDQKDRENFSDKLNQKIGRFLKKGGKSVEADGELEDIKLADIEPAKAKKVAFDGMKTIEIGRRKFVLGLLWAQTYGEKLDEVANSAAGPNSGINLVVDMRKQNQAGLTSREEGVKPGMHVAIKSIPSKYVGSNWIIAVALDPINWWIASIRDGQVYEDQIVRNEASAQSLFFEIHQTGEWDRIVCPETWEVDSSYQAKIEDLLTLPSAERVKSLTPVKDNLKVIILLGLVGSIGGAGYIWYTKRQAAIEEEMARLAQLEAQRVRLIPADFPWANTPVLESFVDQCKREIERTEILAPEWDIGQFRCLNRDDGKGVIEANITGTNGSKAAHLDVAIRINNSNYPNEKPGVLQYNSDYINATYTRDFDLVTDENSQSQTPWDKDKIDRVLKLRSQTAAVSATVSTEIERVTAVQMQRRRTPVFNRNTLSVKTGFALDEVAKLYGDIPALRPSILTYTTDTMTWGLTADVYHPPITR